MASIAAARASNAQLFLQQLHADGFHGGWISTDGTFDSTKFKVQGAYISSFSLDIHTIKSAAPIVSAFKKAFNQDTISFGVPTWIAIQTMAHAISIACTKGHGHITRNSARLALNKVKLGTSLIGRPIAFQPSGDVKGGISFTIFQIQGDGSYKAVQAGLERKEHHRRAAHRPGGRLRQRDDVVPTTGVHRIDRGATGDEPAGVDHGHAGHRPRTGEKSATSRAPKKLSPIPAW